MIYSQMQNKLKLKTRLNRVNDLIQFYHPQAEIADQRSY